MKFTRYQDEYYFYIWKPAGVPSTFGKETSFLDSLLAQEEGSPVFPVVQKLRSEFSTNEERGLLNRLDTATTGLLYFAKSPKVKAEYKTLQQLWKINKYYLLEVYGDLRYWTEKNGFIIPFPIAHHKFSSDRMVVLTSLKDKQKADPRFHSVQTRILETERNAIKWTTTLLVTIQKWVRHQIRIHFSAIGYPILGDSLYGKKKDPYRGQLQLFSVGVKVGGE